MNFSISSIHQTFLSLYKIEFNARESEEVSLTDLREKGDVHSFCNYLIESGAGKHLGYFKNWMNREEFESILVQMHYPLLVFLKMGTDIQPAILYKKDNRILNYSIQEHELVSKEVGYRQLTEQLLTGKDISDFHELMDKILVITCFPNKSLFSEVKDKESTQEKPKTLSRFFYLLNEEKREIGYIYIYAIIAGVISLSLPLGIQSIIGFISSGQITTSVIVLIGFIILGILLAGGLQVMQLWLVEHIQQRLFTRTAFEFAFRIPKIKIESVLKYYPPELMNRFFDIITLQKGMAKVLIEFSAAILQIIFGLILLSLYHSSFILFGIFLIAILATILRFTAPRGLKTSLNESKYKYQVANWLEEIARSISTFKLAGNSNLPMEKTDYFVSGYLHARKHHFKVLVTQYLSFVTFKTLITGGLLIMGCVLLINRQINIGQFVASEIIIILIMNAVEKVIIQLDTFYDVLTSLEKIGAVTDLPIEIPKGIDIEKMSEDSGLTLKIKNLKYKYPSEPSYILKGINAEIFPGERVCISGFSSSGKTTFINILLGFLTSYEGVVTYNNLSMRDINKNSLINLTGDNVSQEDLFEGTIIENITIGRNRVTLENVLWAMDCVGLSEFIHSLPDGLHTTLIGGRLGISESIARKIIIARSIASRPRLLILEDFLLGLEKEQKLKFMELLIGKQHPWTLLLISNDPEIMKLCDRTMIMKEGLIVSSGSYEEIIKGTHFKQLI